MVALRFISVPASPPPRTHHHHHTPISSHLYAVHVPPLCSGRDRMYKRSWQNLAEAQMALGLYMELQAIHVRICRGSCRMSELRFL